MELKPQALEKAESLYKFAERQGSPLSTFKLVLTPREGLELLDYMRSQNEPNELFDLDLEQAKRTGDPFEMLANFQLMGLEILPAQLVH